MASQSFRQNVIILCALFFIAQCTSYNTVPLWADFHTRYQPNDLLSDYQAEFLSTHYEVLSIEKCLNADGGLTEQSFYKIASHLHQYDNTTKVLFYWNAMKCYCDCYEVTKSFYNDQTMWLYDENGDAIYMGSGTTRPWFDLTQQRVRDWWVSALVTVLSNALSQGIQVDGVFIDSVRAQFGRKLSAQRSKQYADGIYSLLAHTKRELKKLNPNMYLLANGMHFHCHPYELCANVSHLMDGTSYEHYAAYEQLDSRNTYPNTYVNVEYIKSVFDISQIFMDQDIDVFIKGWLGPEGTPITANGPSWPSGYETPDGHKYPTNRMEIRNVATALLDYPLAMFLCGIYNENAYFSYGWRWDLNDGYVPCADQMTTCNAPNKWYPQFLNDLGAPLSPVNVLYDGYKCNRTFEHAAVYVDLEDETSANIVWFPPTLTPTMAPTIAPTISPTLTPTMSSSAPTLSIKVLQNTSNSTSSTMKGLWIQLILVAVLLIGCVSYFCYKNKKIKKHVDRSINGRDYHAIPTGTVDES